MPGGSGLGLGPRDTPPLAIPPESPALAPSGEPVPHERCCFGLLFGAHRGLSLCHGVGHTGGSDGRHQCRRPTRHPHPGRGGTRKNRAHLSLGVRQDRHSHGRSSLHHPMGRPPAGKFPIHSTARTGRAFGQSIPTSSLAGRERGGQGIAGCLPNLWAQPTSADLVAGVARSRHRGHCSRG